MPPESDTNPQGIPPVPPTNPSPAPPGEAVRWAPEGPPAPKKKRRWLLPAFIGLVLVSLLFIAGCLVLTAKTIEDATTSAATTEPASEPDWASDYSEEPSAEPSDEPSTDNGPVTVGQSFTWEDGITAKITKLEAGRVSRDDIEGTSGDPKVIVTVKITNNGKKNFDTDEVEVTLTYGRDGDQGESLYNYDGFEGTVARGRSRTAKYDFAIEGRKNLSRISVEVTPTWEHDPAIFEGAAK